MRVDTIVVTELTASVLQSIIPVSVIDSGQANACIVDDFDCRDACLVEKLK